MTFHKNRKLVIKNILLAGLPSLCIVVMASFVLVPFLRMALHLDFSQEYREVQAADQIRFQNNWSGKVYKRGIWGLRPVGRREGSPVEEKPSVAWIDTKVYDVSASGELAAWYDWEKDAIFLGNAEGDILNKFDVMYHGEKLAFSPDEEYLLYYEKQWGWSGGYTTDDDYCYYRVIDLEDGRQYTVYSGYREFFRVYWSD